METLKKENGDAETKKENKEKQIADMKKQIASLVKDELGRDVIID